MFYAHRELERESWRNNFEQTSAVNEHKFISFDIANTKHTNTTTRINTQNFERVSEEKNNFKAFYSKHLIECENC